MSVEYVKQGSPLKAQWANDVVSAIRSRNGGIRKKRVYSGGGSSDTTVCNFGTFSDSLSSTEIKGGIVYVGDKNFNVENYEVDDSERVKLIYFEIPLEVNMDDDAEILLPNVKTSTWTPAWVEGDVETGYPDNTNPTIPAGTGTIIIPLGTLTVALSGNVFDAVDCGNIAIDHCSGTLTHTRT